MDNLDIFYSLLDELRSRLRGYRLLSGCTGRSGWPARGVYFFFEPGEVRRDGSPRVVRVGTHALTTSSRTTLWQRLAQHRGHVGGTWPGGGNHRGSIFRLHVGTALINGATGTDLALASATWASGSSAPAGARLIEYPLERKVSEVIGSMPILWLDVDDPPGPQSERRAIESGSIALLSQISNPNADPASNLWLGLRAERAAVRNSGLWNVQHVNEAPGQAFLEVLDRQIRATTSG